MGSRGKNSIHSTYLCHKTLRRWRGTTPLRFPIFSPNFDTEFYPFSCIFGCDVKFSNISKWKFTQEEKLRFGCFKFCCRLNDDWPRLAATRRDAGQGYNIYLRAYYMKRFIRKRRTWNEIFCFQMTVCHIFHSASVHFNVNETRMTRTHTIAETFPTFMTN